MPLAGELSKASRTSSADFIRDAGDAAGDDAAQLPGSSAHSLQHGHFNSPFAFSVGKSLCAFSRNLCAFSGWSLVNASVAMSMQRSASSLFTSIAAGQQHQQLTGPEVNKGAS